MSASITLICLLDHAAISEDWQGTCPGNAKFPRSFRSISCVIRICDFHSSNLGWYTILKNVKPDISCGHYRCQFTQLGITGELTNISAIPWKFRVFTLVISKCRQNIFSWMFIWTCVIENRGIRERVTKKGLIFMCFLDISLCFCEIRFILPGLVFLLS